MIPYLIMFAVPAIFALMAIRTQSRALWIVALIYWIMIGFRYQVGMDWNNYYYIYLREARSNSAISILSREQGYRLLMLFSRQVGGGLILVDAIGAFIFCFGYFSVARRCREPFLAIAVSTPLLVVAFAMSGLRQSIAMGMIFYLFSTWDERRTLARVLIVLFATFFHFSAVFVLIFVAAASRASLLLRAAASVIVGGFVLMVIKFAPDSMELYSTRYVAGPNTMSAPGAIVEVGALALPALIYLLKRREWTAANGDNRLYHHVALASVLALPSILISSVAAYRFALYFWPMAMYVWSGLPALMESPYARALYRVLLVAASFAVLVAWLLLANNSPAWLPYQNWLLQPAGASLLRHRFMH
jgi:hypothetical protein